MIFDKVKEKIEEKYITTGKTSDLLPSERELAKEFSVSRPTVRKALATLEQEERIIKSEGRGYILKTKATSEKYIDHELDSFIGFFQDAIQQGRKISSKILQQTVVPADSTISAYLEIDPGDLILVLERIRYIDDLPTCIAKSCIPLAVLPEIVEHDFSKESLFSVLEDKGISLAFAKRSIEVTPPNNLENLYLELEDHEPVFVFTSIGFTKEHKPFEYEISKYPAYKTKLTKTFKRYKKQEGLSGSIKGLFHREYEEKEAVKGMDFAVEEGGFVGLIGPNGAGKTTLVKMLTGIIAPTSGEISVMGYYPNKLENDFKRQYAVVMGQKSQLFFELTTEDTLHLFKQIYGLSDRQYQENKEYFVELFGVKELMDVQVRTLSLGERMKMELIVALLHNPRILFLDVKWSRETSCAYSACS